LPPLLVYRCGYQANGVQPCHDLQCSARAGTTPNEALFALFGAPSNRISSTTTARSCTTCGVPGPGGMQNIAPRSQLPAISGLTNASVWRVAATFATGRAQATEQLAELNRRYEGLAWPMWIRATAMRLRSGLPGASKPTRTFASVSSCASAAKPRSPVCRTRLEAQAETAGTRQSQRAL
jgi:hypothetical protein